MKIALIGYGNVGQALARLIRRQQSEYPFVISGIHTARHGTAVCKKDAAKGLSLTPRFGPAMGSIEDFLRASGARVAVELTPLNPWSGEPATSHIRAALDRGLHVVTANKGPIAHAYAGLRDQATRRGVLFRFESTVMDGTPVFNLVRRNLPAVEVLGFTGVLNSTTKIVVETMERGGTFEQGVETARRLGIAEADARFDTDGWDSACKTAALANVLMDAGVTPQAVSARGIGRITPERAQELCRSGKTIRLVSRARSAAGGFSLRVRAEVLEKTDVLASTRGTSNLLLLHTGLMGTLGVVSINPGVDQTAYGVFSDLVEIADAVYGE